MAAGTEMRKTVKRESLSNMEVITIPFDMDLDRGMCKVLLNIDKEEFNCSG